MKNWILLIILLGLAIAAYFVVQRDSGSSISVEDRQFAVEDASSIHKIFIADRSGESTTLERDGDGWIYNNEYPARPGAVENLMEVLTGVELKFIPPKAALNSIVKDLSVNGIKVELYNAADQKIRVYYVGGMTNDERGTYYIMEGSDQPYCMHLPQMEGGLKYRYLMLGDEWKDRRVFLAEAEDLTRVAIEYPKQQGKSFELIKEGGDYFVSSPFLDREQPIKTNRSKAEVYFNDLVTPVAEAFKNDVVKQDSIKATLPFAIVEFETNDGRQEQVRFLPVRQTDPNNRVHVLRYYADCSWGELMMIQHPVFQKVFLSYEHWME